MIAPSSLSAFTPSVPAHPATQVSAPAAARATAPAAVQKPLGGLAPGSAPPRVAPRGSLVDLSV